MSERRDVIQLRKLLICPWFGPLPPWAERYHPRASRLAEHGFDFLFDSDLEGFAARCRRLGVGCSIVPGGSKIHDYRPAFGELYRDEIAGYDFWGHTDYDCAYGRAELFATDELLSSCDIQTDNVYDYLCGPWTLYRAGGATESLFRLQPDWQDLLEDPAVSGWVETSFTEVAKANADVHVRLDHAYSEPQFLSGDGDRVVHGEREVSFYHFRRTKQWPEALA